MPSVEILRPYVEKLLTEWLQVDNLVIDDDGDVPIRYGSVVYYVSLIDRDPPLVRVWANILRGVKKNMKLLEAINEANTTLLQCRMFWNDDAVIVSTEVVADELDKEELIEACDAIANIADEYDDALQKDFGGEKNFEDIPTDGTETVDV